MTPEEKIKQDKAKLRKLFFKAGYTEQQIYEYYQRKLFNARQKIKK